MIHITEAQKKQVIQLLQMGLKEKGEIWVFGSRIKSNLEKKFSDLDLVFVGMPALTGRHLEELKELFTASDLPFKVDICNLGDLPTEIQVRVQQHHECLYHSE